jgi:DNA-binding Lrp family transcriptional regulator
LPSLPIYQPRGAIYQPPGDPAPALLPDVPVNFPEPPMDDIDCTLIRLLQEDASRPLKALAARVNLSRSSVRDRIARLESAGIIRRYTIETAEPSATPAAILLVRLARTPDRDAVQAIVAHTNVVRCYSLSGDVDLLVEIRGADIDRINSTRDEIALLPGVTDVETSFILKREKAPG